MDHTEKNGKLLEVKDLHVSFFTPAGEVKAVGGISYDLNYGEVMGIVGESGSGKSVEAYSIIGLLQSPGKVIGGSITFEGEDVLATELGEPLPVWADKPEARQAVRACVEELGLRYQIEGKILAPIPVNKKQRRKKLAGKYLWPDVPGDPASALRWVYLAGKGWLAPTVLKEHAAVFPLVLKVRADGITDKGDYRPLELEPWEFRLLARRTLERLEQNMTKCEVCK